MSSGICVLINRAAIISLALINFLICQLVFALPLYSHAGLILCALVCMMPPFDPSCVISVGNTPLKFDECSGATWFHFSASLISIHPALQGRGNRVSRVTKGFFYVPGEIAVEAPSCLSNLTDDTIWQNRNLPAMWKYPIVTDFANCALPA